MNRALGASGKGEAMGIAVDSAATDEPSELRAVNVTEYFVPSWSPVTTADVDPALGLT
jgi:hypothetical protein